MGRSRKTVTNTGMAARSSQLPEGERAEQKGQPGVRDGDVFWDPRYSPCALGSPKYVGEGPREDSKAKAAVPQEAEMQAESHRWSLVTRASPLKHHQIMN